jgi:hypothetical protein
MNQLPTRTCRIYCAIILALCGAARPQPAPAAMLYDVDKDGRVVSSTADFTASGDVLTVKITNTTPVTLGVHDLLTGIDFSLNGLTPTLTSVTGLLRSIGVDGAFSDGTSAQNLSWSLKSLGGDAWRLDSHPDAEHAIVGPASSGSYAGVSRSVRGNPGHNPLAAEVVIATLNVPGLSSTALPFVTVRRFGFSASANNTITPSGPLEIPEPSTWSMFILLMVVGTTTISRARRPG